MVSSVYLNLRITRITNYSFTIDFPVVHSDDDYDYEDEVGKSTKLAQVHVAGGTQLKLKFFYN